MTARPLPRRQQQVLDFIRSELAAGREFPSSHVIAFEIGWRGDTCAREALQALAGFGHLTKRNHRGRWVYALPLPSGDRSASAPLAGPLQPNTLAATVLGDELDSGRFERRADLSDDLGRDGTATCFEVAHAGSPDASRFGEASLCPADEAARGAALGGCEHGRELHAACG